MLPGPLARGESRGTWKTTRLKILGVRNIGVLGWVSGNSRHKIPEKLRVAAGRWWVSAISIPVEVWATYSFGEDP